MFKKLLTFAMTVVLIFAFALPVEATNKDMWAYVYSWDGRITGPEGKLVVTRITSGITFIVLQADSDTLETTYVKGSTTSLTNPVTTTSYNSSTICNDQIAFRVDPGHSGDEYVDLIVTNADGGFGIFVENFDQYTHAIVIDQRPNVVHSGTVRFDHSFGSATEIDTGINFLYDTMIIDVRTETVTADSGITIEVGLLASENSGDADGFIDARSVAAAGYTEDTGFITDSTSAGDYTPDSTFGDLMYVILAGADQTSLTLGGRSYIGHVVDYALQSAVSLTYTLLTAADTADGYIHYRFIRFR